MTVALVALLLAALAPPAAPSQVGPQTPPPATSAPVTVTAAPPDPEETAKTVAQMQDMYDQGCASREYGAYDDVCDVLRTQLRQARADAERQARKAKAAAAHRPSTPPN